MAGASVQQRAQQAQNLAGQGRLEEALRLVQAAPVSEREALTPLRINLLKALERHDEVVPLRRAQAVASPNSVAAQHNLASSLGDTGANIEAELYARKAMKLGGDAPETWIVLARSLQGQNRFDEACEAFRQVIARRSDYVEAINELAQALWMSGATVEQARAPYEQALGLHPSHPLILKGLAVFNEYVGMEPRGIWQDLEARYRKGGVSSVQVELAASHVALRFDPDLALRHAERAVQLAPQDFSAWTMLAQSQLVSGQMQQALEVLPQILQAQPYDQTVLALNATASRVAGLADPMKLDQPQGLIEAYQIDTPEGWDSLADYLADLKLALERQHSFDRHPIGQSLRHGTQTPVDLRRVDDPVIKAFFKAIDGPIRCHLAAMGQGSDPVRSRNTGNYRFAGCWSVRLGSGGFHESHIHPKGWLSSACYIDLPDAVDRGGQEGWIAFGVPPFPLKTSLTPLKVEKPSPGKLVLFPSCMWHGTLPFEDERPRLTIAFDLLPD